MKKIGILMVALLWSVGLLAQQEGQRYDKEKLDAARVAFITNRLDLTTSQAEKFWPLFNTYNEERLKLMGEISNLDKTAFQETDENKAKSMIKQRIDFQQELLDNEKVFMDKVVKIITPSQALRLGSVNRDFTRHLYRMQQGHRKGRGN